jgi:hypothetical protein
VRGHHGPPHYDLQVLAACFVLAIVLAAAGVITLARAGLALKKRIEAYRELPILRGDLERTQLAIATAERRIDSVPFLAARARRAVGELDAVRRRNRLIALSLIAVVRRTYFTPAAPPPTTERNPES